MRFAPDIKSYIVGLAMIIASGFFWFFASKTAGEFSWYNMFGILSVSSLTCYFLVVSLALILYQERRFFSFVVGLSLVPLFVFFFVTPVYILVFFLVVLASIRSFSLAKDELHNRMTFRVIPPLRMGLPVLLTAFSVLLAAVYYFTTGVAMSVSPERLLPRSFFNAIIKTTEPNILQFALPGFNRLLTVDEYIRAILRKDSSMAFDVLSSGEQAELLELTRLQLFKEFDIEVKGDELLGDAFYKAIVVKSERLLEPYKQSIPLAFAIAMFLFLRTVAFPYTWLIICASWGIMKILLKLGVVEIQRIERPQEFVTWRRIG